MKRFLLIIPIGFLNLFSSIFAQTSCQDTSLIDPGMICPTVIDFVCGCDGVTYNNGCEATFYYGITSYTQGPCGQNSCQADFTYTTGQSSCEYVFTGLGAVLYNWDFGDGNTGQGENITHNFSADGTYNIQMISMNQNGIWCDTVTQTITVSGCSNNCQAGFSATIVNCDGTFYASGADTYLWDFGDGSTGQLGSTTHSYNLNGLYEVCLYAFEASGVPCDTVCQTFEITGCEPQDSCALSWQVDSDNNCLHIFQAEGANSFEWFYDDMAFIGDSISIYIPANNTIPLCLYGFDAQGQLCDTICEVFTCPTSNIISIDQWKAPIVFPNPMAINKELKIISESHPLETIQVRNALGQAVPFECRMNGQNEWTLKFLNNSKGIYVLEMKSGGAIFKERVVLMH